MARFRFDINSMVAFEEAVDQSFLETASKKEKAASFKTLRALYWAGTDTKISLEEAGKKLTEELKSGATLEKIYMEITKAIEESCLIPGSGGDETENPQKISE